MPPLHDDDALVETRVYVWVDKDTATEYCVFAKSLLEAGLILRKRVSLASKLIKTPPQVKPMPELMIIDRACTHWYS